ncbi:MAG: oleate hydratase [Thiobacillus sp.]|jgi:myosin-crossreactive antigen|uniref:oleate hydratase n=1 Tax=Thiobacillus sp. TaxID=924 RepID=UPI002893CA4A|nr:oleate hydratase [Thiobacillus sp.]MDT3706193.1 oleate hydratase [Thiobacillus sp.]
MMDTLDMAKAYIVGGGIASLSAAVLLIRDAGFHGANIRDKLIDHKRYIRQYGEDMPEIREWKWGATT